MALGDYSIIGPPDLTFEQFRDILIAAGSPAAPEAHGMYSHLVAGRGVSPAAFLAFFRHESQYGKVGVAKEFGTNNPGNVRTPEIPGLASGIVDTPRGQFAAYPDWRAGTQDWVARILGPKYAGSGLFTVRSVIPKYAPTGDQDNVPEAYIASVLRSIEEWTQQGGRGATVGHVPRPPITDHIVTVPPRRNGVGLTVNTWDRIPRGTVLHSMGGTLRGTDGYFQQPSCPALTDFGIGQTDHGGGFAQIIQWCDFRGRIEPWASGPVRVPEGDGPRFLATWGGAEKLNEAGISIEHDDTTLASGGTVQAGGAPVTVYQWSASCWLQAWLHAEVLGQTDATYDWNMWHREFTGAAYKTCPNPRITDFGSQYQAAVRAIMRHFQAGADYPAGGLVIDGMRINTPPEGDGGGGDEVKVPARGTAISYLTDDGQPVSVIAWDGAAAKIDGTAYVDVGITVTNAAGERYSRSLTNGAMLPWFKED
jgi:hypothetical protein